MMGMLDRYRKKGGFAQLVYLIEGCDLKKQATLLEHVKKEDPQWASLVQQKMLTIEKIWALPVEVINEIVTRLPEKVLVFALFGIAKDKQEELLKPLVPLKRKNAMDLLTAAAPPPNQIEAANLQVIKRVRDLEREGTVKLIKVDPVYSLEIKVAA